jgi:hypothetical protein
MKRVSSRPRLFSGDHFDAAAQEQPEEEGMLIYGHGTSPTSLQSMEDDDYMSCISNLKSARESQLSLKSYTCHEDLDEEEASLEDLKMCSSPSSVTPNHKCDIPRIVSPHVSSISDVPDVSMLQLDVGSKKRLREPSHDDGKRGSLLQEMNQDILIHILQYLSLNELKAVSVTDQYFYNLLTLRNIKGEEVKGVENILFFQHMKQTWSLLDDFQMKDVAFVQNENVKVKSEFMPDRHQGINYLSTLSNAIQSPSCIGEKYLSQKTPTRQRRLRGFAGHMGIPLHDDEEEDGEEETRPMFRDFRYKHQGQDVEVVQFVQPIGRGDRSLVSNLPFPRPIFDEEEERLITRNPFSIPRRQQVAAVDNGAMNNPQMAPMSLAAGLPAFPILMEEPQLRSPFAFTSRRLNRETRVNRTNSDPLEADGRPNIFERIRGCTSIRTTAISRAEAVVLKCKRATKPQPFVAPYVARVQNGIYHMDMTPRYMAYFEITILPRDVSQEPKVEELRNRGNGPLDDRERLHMDRLIRTNQDECCVAVGLSTDYFGYSTRMPGWDPYSYGYHSDDGGIFHSRGAMIRVYGPTYNVGDTVGCGVNYENGGIFYTLNGNFLGYAWMNERKVMDRTLDLYPTVGIDSNDPIACNFGNERPFMFNFAGFVQSNGDLPIAEVDSV